ncbi:MAG: hypothetical protein KGM47_06265 [Acidobacteriota bacterium]|nr:hypothetical protein [Acidobacteriota bacterium]
MNSHLAKRLWPCVALFVLLPLPAQKSVVIPLLPVPVWRPVSANSIPLQDLSQYGDVAAVNEEAGVTSANKRTYQMRDRRVSAIFIRAADPSSAYSLFTLYKEGDMEPVRGVDLAVANGSYALMTRGRYFIRVLQPANAALPEAALKSLLVSIGGARISAENASALPSGLPPSGLLPGSGKYMLGAKSAEFAFPSFPANLVGFADGVEAQAGSYLENGKKTVLFEISYPTPQIAHDRFQPLAESLHFNQGFTTAFGRLDGSFILLALDAGSHDAAVQFLNRFRINQVVSAVPQYPRKENIVLDVVQLFIANGELIGIIVLLSILGGISIYLIKRLIMKLFPNSHWIKTDEETLIRLRLD